MNRKQTITHLRLALLALAAVMMPAGVAQAGVLNIDFTRFTEKPTTFDMSQIGGLDWVIWDGLKDDEMQVFDQKLDGTAIGIAEGFDGGFGRQGIALFSWSDGKNEPSASSKNPNNVANTDQGSKSFTFDVDVAEAGSYTLSVIMGVYATNTSTQVATLNGSSATANFTAGSNFGPANYALVEVDFTTTGADTLTFTGNEGNNNGNTFLVGAGVSVIPEPGVPALLGLGMAITLMRRRVA